MAIRFLERDEIVEMHADLLADHGGTAGIRDEGLLESAIAAPRSGFGNAYLHADLFEMAAAYLFHLVKNHPFLDGNKRIGLAAALQFLALNDRTCSATDEALVELTLGVAEGRVSKEEIASFFRAGARTEEER